MVGAGKDRIQPYGEDSNHRHASFVCSNEFNGCCTNAAALLNASRVRGEGRLWLEDS